MSLSHKEVVQRLQKQMPNEAFELMCKQMRQYKSQTENLNKSKNEMYIELFDKFVFPKIRQYGNKVVLKIRFINIDNNDNIFRLNNQIVDETIEDILKFNPYQIIPTDYDTKSRIVLSYLTDKKVIKRIKHLGFWIGGKLYHWRPNYSNRDLEMYGEDETNREITNDWETDKLFLNKSYFTIRTHEEIMNFCDFWMASNTYSISNCNHKDFTKKLNDYLHLFSC